MRRTSIAVIAAALLTAIAAFAAQAARRGTANSSLDRQLQEQERIVQALDRLTWGIAPGDVARVEQIGLQKWIDQQLHPNRIPENPALVAALAPYDSLRMSSVEIVRHYPPPELIQAMANGKAPLPSDGAARAMAEREIELLRRRQAQKQEAGGAAAPGAPEMGEARPPDLRDVLAPEQIRSLRQGPPEDRVQAFLALPPGTQTAALAAMPRGMAQQIAVWGPPQLEREIEAQLTPQVIVPLDLQSAKILRAVAANRQLEDVLTDFWLNHFNIFINKGADRFLITAYERDAIRPHVLGKFYDLLVATAESPAMLFYLDNWQSVDPHATERLAAERRMRQMMRMQRLGPFAPFPPPLPPPQPAKKAPQRGLNENYGREVMELHTVGLHYTQADVIAAARCFTGWTIGRPGLGGPFRDPEFYYNAPMHDQGEKIVLGQRIPAGGGMNDGLEVLKILARDPDTAQHVSYELAQRFVADDPPPALVARMAAAYMRSDGDLRQVMTAMIQAPEFWDASTYRNKVKSPLEMVVSALRATGARITNPTRLTQIVAQMGQPLYGKEPPTGYDNTGEQWVSASGLLARMNFAQDLAANRVPGARVDLSQFAPGPADAGAVTAALFDDLLMNQVSENTKNAIQRELTKAAPEAVAPDRANPRPLGPAQVAMLTGLVLGSPEFQKH